MEFASKHRSDALGVLCSLLCAIHCAATPLLLTIVPSVLGLQLFANPLFHQISAVLCAVLVMRAIVPNWIVYRDRAVLWLAITGLSLLFLSAFVLPDACCEHLKNVDVSQVSPQSSGGGLAAGFSFAHSAPLLTSNQLADWLGPWASHKIIESQPLLTPLGGLLLIMAHVFNIQLSRCSRHSNT